jgi:hypothetical protein
LLVKESGGEYKDNMCYLETINDELVALVGIDHHNDPYSKLTVQTKPANRPE